jgi:hypothetical protein
MSSGKRRANASANSTFIRACFFVRAVGSVFIARRFGGYAKGHCARSFPLQLPLRGVQHVSEGIQRALIQCEHLVDMNHHGVTRAASSLKHVFPPSFKIRDHLGVNPNRFLEGLERLCLRHDGVIFCRTTREKEDNFSAYPGIIWPSDGSREEATRQFRVNPRALLDSALAAPPRPSSSVEEPPLANLAARYYILKPFNPLQSLLLNISEPAWTCWAGLQVQPAGSYPVPSSQGPSVGPSRRTCLRSRLKSMSEARPTLRQSIATLL